MEIENIKELIGIVTSNSDLNKYSKKILGKGISQIYNFVRFKIDPLGRYEYQKQLIDALKKKQLKLFNQSLEIIHKKHIDEIKKKESQQQVIEATMAYLNNPVFIEFINSIGSKKSNWKGGSRKNEKQYIEEGYWWDIFCDLMNRRHEKWRAKLLAEAMRLQVSGEGIVNSTTLWKIAMLPAHSWFDLTEFLSLAGELRILEYSRDGKTTKEKYYKTFIPGAFSKVTRLSYLSSNGERRLISDLDTSMTQDGLSNTESGPIILRKEDKNLFVFGDEKYEISPDPDYIDEYITDENLEDTDFHKNYFRIYGIWLSYSGEEIIQLADSVEMHEEAMRIFEFFRKDIEKEDGIIIKKI